MAVRIDTEASRRRATRTLCRFIPAARWATLIGAVLFGAPADALWAIAALGAAVVSPQQ